jgi:hypothetical protein
LAADVWHRQRVTDSVAQAFQRFADALNDPRDPARLRAAVTDDIVIDRHRPGERDTQPVLESFAGIAAVEQWLARTPPVVRFSLAGAAWPAADGDAADRWGIAYAYDAGDFHHGGIWLARLAGDGRIAALSHQPYALGTAPPDAPAEPHAHGGGGGGGGGHGHGHG